MEKESLAKHLDLANHHQEATLEDIRELCAAVLEHGLNSAFVNPCWVAEAKSFLAGGAKVGTVISFPLGQETQEIKLAAIKKAIEDGADELDVSLNVALFKAGQWEEAQKEASDLVRAAKGIKQKVIVKLIIETGCLTEEEVKKASEIVLATGADFVKTCSGLGPRGATLRDVELIREAVGTKIKIKVAGGIETTVEAISFLEKGADRIGTSHAVEILENILLEEAGPDDGE